MRGYVSVDVRIDEVLDDLSDDDLLEEIKRRKASPLKSKLDEIWRDDLKALRAAVIDNDGATAVAILLPVLAEDHIARRQDQYAKLQRDPQTGRPVIQ